MSTLLVAILLSAASPSERPVRYLKVKDVAGKAKITFDAPYGAPDDLRVKRNIERTNDRCVHAACAQSQTAT